MPERNIMNGGAPSRYGGDIDERKLIPKLMKCLKTLGDFFGRDIFM